MSQPPQTPQTPPHGAQHGPYTFDANRGEWILTAVAPPTGYDPVQPPKKRKTWPWVIAAIVVAGLAVSALLPSESEGKSDDDRMIALCQKLVTDEAATPSTVSFVSATVESAGDGWVVSGEADGQNLFGAMIRESYKCEVSHDAEKDVFSARVIG